MQLPDASAMILPLVSVLAMLATLVAGHHGAWSSQEHRDQLSVIDGDTLQLNGDVIQLYGIDAPELGQLCESRGSLWHCGTEAAFALRKLLILDEASLHCSPWDEQGAADPASAATLQVCEVGDEDLAVVMLHNGNSVALPGAFPAYLDAEEDARQASLGVWHSDFVLPWEWRAGVQSVDRASDSVRECNVKGVVGADGQRIYYVPTDAEYRGISVDLTEGDALFCSDDEARLAGWRRAGEMVRAD